VGYSGGDAEREIVMRLRHVAITATVAAGLLSAPTAALAQEAAGDPYTRTPPGEVLSEELQRPTEVLPAQITRADPATLPVTGTDAVTLTIVGLAAIAGGTVLVRRSRFRPAEATA
jgi:LPXTG-motif cell wall-anchored protein